MGRLSQIEIEDRAQPSLAPSAYTRKAPRIRFVTYSLAAFFALAPPNADQAKRLVRPVATVRAAGNQAVMV